MTLEMMLPPDHYEWMDEEEIEQCKALLERRLSGPPPSTIDELRDWNAEEGIGSILDMLRVDSVQEYGTVSPLTDDQLHDLYGTTKPTHEQIEQAKQIYRKYRERGEGLYIIVYKTDEPSEIFFAGSSGD